ncbi:MAG: hypothetical protein ICV83_26570 [Cytophagales bacterium]|nr:hypothetical protein [Cytophagales bacterium]
MKPLYLLLLAVALSSPKPSGEEQAAAVIANARQVLHISAKDLSRLELKGTSAQNGGPPSSSRVWIKDKKMRLEYRFSDGNQLHFVTNGSKAHKITNGRVEELPYPQVEGLVTSMRQTLRQPGLNLEFANHPDARVLMLSPDTSYQGQPCYLVGVGFRGTPQFRFLIHRQTYQLLFESNETGSLACENYQPVGPARLPFRTRTYVKSTATTTIREFELVRINADIPDSLFEVK